ncbi:12308_t:CDS:2 [Acaulospora colombiana]|uniref:12308_t:CDS:1 n=1 Tax=Acaulospora colombiana TaxID=27376 RepID=A0ACA9KJX6_9GLOM|nr:12308_t:CDS:2 [Acaulospora colombiana]
MGKYNFNVLASQGSELRQFSAVEYSSSFDRELAIRIRDDSLSADVDSPSHGLLNDIHPIHLKPHATKSNVFTHRMTYCTRLNAYYENGVTDRIYIENWDRGTYDYRNVVRVQSFETKRHVCVRIDLSFVIMCSDKLNFRITSLTLRLIHILVDRSATIEWDIAPAPLEDGAPLNWKKINFPGNMFNDGYGPMLIETSISITRMLKGCTGFMLRASEISWENTLIFPQDLQEYGPPGEGEILPMDIYLELTPDPDPRLVKEIVHHTEPLPKIGGLFNEKYACNVVPHDTKPETFSHRMRYNTRTNSYYENERTDKKFLKRWDRGTLKHENISYQPELEIHNRKVYLARNPNKISLPAYISWRFDYRPGGYLISSLTLKLSHSCWCECAKIEWSICPLPTRDNTQPEWKPLHFNLREGRNLRRTFKYSDQRIDATEHVKDQYGFTLKAHMSGGVSDGMWKKTQLFRQDLDKSGKLDGEEEETFGMDVRVDLVPDIRCEPTVKEVRMREFIKSENLTWCEYTIKGENVESESLTRNDNKTDFNIIFKAPGHHIQISMHRAVLVSFSDYFVKLFDTKMRESQFGYVEWPHDSLLMLEIIIEYMYTGEVKGIHTLEEWMELLQEASVPGVGGNGQNPGGSGNFDPTSLMSGNPKGNNGNNGFDPTSLLGGANPSGGGNNQIPGLDPSMLAGQKQPQHAPQGTPQGAPAKTASPQNQAKSPSMSPNTGGNKAPSSGTPNAAPAKSKAPAAPNVCKIPWQEKEKACILVSGPSNNTIIQPGSTQRISWNQSPCQMSARVVGMFHVFLYNNLQAVPDSKKRGLVKRDYSPNGKVEI